MTFIILISFLPQSHEIHDLEIYTQYLISIQVFNPEGLGPATSVVVMTDEGGECDFLFVCLSEQPRRVMFYVLRLIVETRWQFTSYHWGESGRQRWWCMETKEKPSHTRWCFFPRVFVYLAIMKHNSDCLQANNGFSRLEFKQSHFQKRFSRLCMTRDLFADEHFCFLTRWLSFIDHVCAQENRIITSRRIKCGSCGIVNGINIE